MKDITERLRDDEMYVDACDEAACLIEQQRAELAEKDNALKQLKEYFEENHAERIMYPEYLEFHEYHMILLALGIVEKP